MQFHVEHDAIRQFGRTVRHLADDADTAVAYTRDHLGIGYDKGRMFFTVVEKATEVRDALMENYKLLAKFADQSGAEVVKAADMYRDTDQAAAASVDASYHLPAATRTPHYS